MMTVVKSASRGAFLGAVAVGLLMLLFLPGVSVLKRVTVLAGLITAMAFAAPPGYWKTMNDFVSDPQSDYNWDAYSGRRNIAKRGVGYMLQYPIFGVGINNFTFAEGQLSEKAKSGEVVVRWAAPHNSFVQAGAETGVIGLALWLTVMITSGGGMWRLRKRMPSWDKGTPEQRFLYLSTLFVPAAFIGFAVTAFFVSFAWSDQYYLLPVIVVGAYKAHERIVGPAAGAVPAGARRRR
jgi:O-antigen ligase